MHAKGLSGWVSVLPVLLVPHPGPGAVTVKPTVPGWNPRDLAPRRPALPSSKQMAGCPIKGLQRRNSPLVTHSCLTLNALQTIT